MSQMLKQLLHEEADRIDIPPAPVRAIVVDGRRRRTVRRTQVLVAVAASVAIVVGGSVGVTRLLADGGQVQPSPVGPPSSPTKPVEPSPTTPIPSRTVVVDGTSVAGQPFGSPEARVQAALEVQLGDPDTGVGPEEYGRIPGNQGYFQDAEDNLSPSWAYRFTAVSCWQVFCVIYGGDDADSLKLRGWELAQYNRWSDGGRLKDLTSPDVRLADSRVGLGDTWRQLHAAFPSTRVADAEGGSLSVRDTPWPGIFDGVAEWRLKGYWDADRPGYAPDDATLIRLSGGEGPQPGCC